jgi:hypothetical protein
MAVNVMLIGVTKPATCTMRLTASLKHVQTTTRACPVLLCTALGSVQADSPACLTLSMSSCPDSARLGSGRPSSSSGCSTPQQTGHSYFSRGFDYGEATVL